MKFDIALILGLASVAFVLPATVHATSCSQWAESCVRNAPAMHLPASSCNAPKRACLSACQHGKPAYFVGPKSHKSFPASECK